MSNTIYAQRRQKVAKQLAKHGAGAIAVVFNSPIHLRNGWDVERPHRPDSNFYYLTGLHGFGTDGSVAVIRADATSVLFTTATIDDITRRFYGDVVGVERAKTEYGFDEVYSIDELDDRMRDYLIKCETLYHNHIGRTGEQHRKVGEWIWAAREKANRSWHHPVRSVCDLASILEPMRHVKDRAEISHIRRATAITAEGACAAMRICQPGMQEYEIEAEVNRVFRNRGCGRENSFITICAAGPSALRLHYQDNNRTLRDGDLFLLDCGAELEHNADGGRYYGGDVSRTFPVNGKFSPSQRAVYEIVLAAQEAGIRAIVPGGTHADPQRAAVEIIVAGLKDLGLLKGSIEEEIEKGKAFPAVPMNESNLRFYPHSFGHHVGLDTHDIGNRLRWDGAPWKFKVGNVVTAEPGIYIPCDPDIPEEFQGIGIRIEDDILVTKNGPVVLTAAAPKTIDAIEALMAA